MKIQSIFLLISKRISAFGTRSLFIQRFKFNKIREAFLSHSAPGTRGTVKRMGFHFLGFV